MARKLAVVVLLGCCTADDRWTGAGLGWDRVSDDEEAAALAWARQITAPAPYPPSPPSAPSPPMAPFVCVALPLLRWWWWSPLAWFDWAVNIGTPCVEPPDEEEVEVQVEEAVRFVPEHGEPPVARDARIDAAHAPLSQAAASNGAAVPRAVVAPGPAGNVTFAGSSSRLVDRDQPGGDAANFTLVHNSTLVTDSSLVANHSLATNSSLATSPGLVDWLSLSHQEGALAGGGAAAFLLMALALLAGRGRKARSGALLSRDLERSDEAGPSAVGEIVAGLHPKPSRAPPPDWWLQARQWGSDVK